MPAPNDTRDRAASNPALPSPWTTTEAVEPGVADRTSGRTSPSTSIATPPLTSTFWDIEQVAEQATRFLLEAIGAEGPQATLRDVVAPVLVTRGSTEAAA